MIGDVGQDRREEVDIWRPTPPGSRTTAGAATRARSSTTARPRSTRRATRVGPIHQYSPRAPAAARSPAASSTAAAACRTQRGRYFFGDYCTGGRVELPASRAARASAFRERSRRCTSPGNLSSFGEGPTRELYFVSHSGRIFRLAEAGSSARRSRGPRCVLRARRMLERRRPTTTGGGPRRRRRRPTAPRRRRSRTKIGIEEVAGGFDSPVQATAAPGDADADLRRGADRPHPRRRGRPDARAAVRST